MSILKHYFLCAVRLGCRLIVNSVSLISQKCMAAKSLCYCSWKVLVEKENTEISTCLLKKFYENEGDLCKSIGFVHENCKYDLSIIIPMYNVSEYIVECIDSIVQQNTKYRWEIILVDDGSTDDTLQKIEIYLQDKRVTLIRQENRGQSSARNNAIYHSQGKYLMFVDGDDVLLNSAIECLMETATTTRSDIAEGQVLRFHKKDDLLRVEDGGYVIDKKTYSKTPRFVLTSLGYSVAKVYNRELWKTLRYPEGYIFEDVITKFILRRKANQVARINKNVYGYRWNMNSSSHGKVSLKHLDSVWVFPQVLRLCEEEKVPKDDVFYLLALNHIGILNYSTTRKQEEIIQRACFCEMRKQLTELQKYRAKRIPYMFRLLEKAILDGNFENWKLVSDTICKYGMLKKWREIN